jgi:hypothetical protein
MAARVVLPEHHVLQRATWCLRRRTSLGDITLSYDVPRSMGRWWRCHAFQPPSNSITGYCTMAKTQRVAGYIAETPGSSLHARGATASVSAPTGSKQRTRSVALGHMKATRHPRSRTPSATRASRISSGGAPRIAPSPRTSIRPLRRRLHASRRDRPPLSVTDPAELRYEPRLDGARPCRRRHRTATRGTSPRQPAASSKSFRRGRIGPCPVADQKEKAPASGAFRDGRYWARTSDPQLVELVLSQLS